MRMIGNYELLELIGRGGMGEVWRARHRLLGRDAAIKLIRPEVMGGSPEQNATAIRRFEKEARTAAMLRSPHSIQILDFGVSDDGAFYQAMELLDGLDLQVLVERHGPMPSERVTAILRQICDALAEAHAAGFVHRDIKPSNLLVCSLGTTCDFVKVLDFGLVKAISGATGKDSLLTRHGAVLGSPAYLSPEAIRSADLDDKADVYALGCVAWWLLTGHLVFEADTAIDMFVSHLEKRPSSMMEASSQEIPSNLERLVLACLSKDRDDRPSIRELSQGLAATGLHREWTEARAEAWWRALPVGALRESTSKELFSPQPLPRKIDTEMAMADPLTTRERADLGATDLPARKERVYLALKRHFEESRIDLLEMEKRLILARKAETPGELGAVVADLPDWAEAPAEVVPVKPVEAAETQSNTPLTALVPAAPMWANLWGVLSGHQRKGIWKAPPRTRSIAFLGGNVLDFRMANLGPGMTEVKCLSFLGGTKIVIPPDMYFEVDGLAILGGFGDAGTVAQKPEGEGSWLRITGFSLLGGVEVVVRQRPSGRPLAGVMADLADAASSVGLEIAEKIEEAVSRKQERAETRAARREERNRKKE